MDRAALRRLLNAQVVGGLPTANTLSQLAALDRAELLREAIRAASSGPRGPQGQQGPQGPHGATGPAGRQGDPGDAGRLPPAVAVAVAGVEQRTGMLSF